MLEFDPSEEVIDILWQKLNCRIELPETPDEYFAAKGPQLGEFAPERQHARYNYRNKALLIYRNAPYAVFTKDISHSSVGFLHFEQLFPLERVRLYLANGTKLDATIRRCLRLQELCFECGAQVEANDRMTAKQLRDLFQDSL